MQGDDPPFLPVGTDVSAKYKGAFCEAKIKKVVRNIKCKLTLKAGGTITVNDDVIKGVLRVGSTVEVKQDPKKDAVEASIAKIQDCSQYTVVFDDGDITTLRRSALCLKSGRHFNESETLDQLPLTHPEHFSTPVIAGRRGRRGRAQSDESEGEVPTRRPKADSAEREPHVGRVVLVEAAGAAERRRPHQPAFPALVVAPTAQIKVKEDYLVRSFKDGRYYTVPKKEAREFRKGSAPLEWCGVEAALQYLNNGVLPPHWDRDALFNEPRNTSDDSSDDEPREEKDHFVAQLYKFMDDRSTPLNRNPTIANRDIDLYKLFRVVQKLGGYNRVTNQNQWKIIADKMGFHPVTTSITNLCKQAYKKFLHSFEDFYRKLGVTLVAHPRGARTPPAGRSLIRDRDKQPPTSSSASSTPTGTPNQRKDKDSDKSETEKSDKSEKDEKVEKPKEKPTPRASDGEDSADNQPLAIVTPKIEKEKEKEKEKDNKSTTSTSTSEEKIVPKPRPRSLSKSRSVPPAKTDSHEKRMPKRRPLSSKPGESPIASTSRASRRPHVSTDSDSSGRASRCGPTKKMQSRRSQSANSASSGNTIASNSSKRPRKRKITEPSTSEPTRSGGANVKAQVGDKLKVYYGPTQSESKVTYEAKVIEVSAEGMLRVHYTGWNTRYDEWIKPMRIALNVTQHEARNKKNTGLSRRVRAKRTEESSARSDTDSDTDSESDVKRPPKKSEDKSGTKTPRSKDAKSSDSSSSSKPRKRPMRTVSTPSTVSPAKKPRPNLPSHQGRDYDLNEIRSELKGLHTVKQEPEDNVKHEVKTEKNEDDSTPAQASVPPPDPPQPDKQPEDVYEFKEPEPFELELHDEKKKRTHRIFDDISPSKYTLTLSKSLSEEISEDPLRPRASTSTLRSPSLSPFRDFGAREPPGRDSPGDDINSDMFSLDDDSFQDGSLGPIFEGFTPAKNQETYSKKNKVSKLRELIDDSPDSPADDEQSSDDEPDEVMKEDETESSVTPPAIERPKTPEIVFNDASEVKESEPMKEVKILVMNSIEMPPEMDVSKIPKPPTTPPPTSILSLPSTSITVIELPSTSAQKRLDAPYTSAQKKMDNPSTSAQKKMDTPSTSWQKKIDAPSTSKKMDIPSTSAQKKIDTPIISWPKKLDIPIPSTFAQKKMDAASISTPKKLDIPIPSTSAQKKIDAVSPPIIKKMDIPIPSTSGQKKMDFPSISIQKKLDAPGTFGLKKLDAPSTYVDKKIDTPSTSSTIIASTSITIVEPKPRDLEEELAKDEEIKLLSIPLPSSEPKENIVKIKIEKKLDPEPIISKLEPPSSPLIDTEEDKSEPDSPARIDVLPEPPAAFLLQSEGPKIAEKLLKAINSAKRLSMSPPPIERPNTPKKDVLKITKVEGKSSPIATELKIIPTIIEPLKPLATIEAIRKVSPIIGDSIFGEPSKLTDAKRDLADIRKVKPKEPTPTPPRLQSPLSILERRKSVADLPLPALGKNNKVLSDTIQKLSSQINQSAANIPLPPFPPEDRSESSDSDDSDRRLIIDKLSVEEWGSGAGPETCRLAAAVGVSPAGAGAAGAPVGSAARALHAGKSPGEWSAGETLLMLEDACKNERKHSANVVVAGSGRVAAAGAVVGADDDSNISLLLCSETIPGSPAPDAEPAPTRHRLHMPFASAPPHHQHKAEERRTEGVPREAPVAEEAEGSREAREGREAREVREAGEALAGGAGWARRHAVIDNTPPTTPDSSLDMSPQPHRERRISERDSPSERKEDEDESRQNDASLDMDKPHGSRSRKASESSCVGAGRGRRRARRDTDDAHAHSNAPLKYNFYVDLDPSWDSLTRINVITTRLTDLRKAYHSVKAELAAIDRRRKKLRRKEREAVKAAKAACS